MAGSAANKFASNPSGKMNDFRSKTSKSRLLPLSRDSDWLTFLFLQRMLLCSSCCVLAGLAPEKETSEGVEDYRALKQEVELQVRELERQHVPLQQSEFDQWGSQIADLRERILAANRSGSLDAEQTHTLLAGLRSELSLEHDIRRPPQPEPAEQAQPTETQPAETQPQEPPPIPPDDTTA